MITGDHAGTKEVTLSAHHRALSWLTMTARVPVRIAEERGDARFPLRVGNRWRYEVTRSDKVAGVVKLMGAEGHREVQALQVRVEAPVEIAGGGLRAFRLALEGEPRGEIQVYAGGGELVFLDKEGSHLPLLSMQASAGTLEPPAAAPGFGPLQGASCTFGVVGALPGPAVCQKELAVHKGFQLGIGLLTAGFMAPGDTTVVWNLVETAAGPADAPSVVSSRGGSENSPR